eukprot:TRINITY_DN10306_c0_g1_i1.p4 TRINITY_DN10306_c0_g1~~TRINITY_DN10306_c0_g1_i1.p4  ORF type:complete len:103 (-),score=16.18 TRINITY_DN10306_c0_g1_i1:813-1121(-)
MQHTGCCTEHRIHMLLMVAVSRGSRGVATARMRMRQHQQQSRAATSSEGDCQVDGAAASMAMATSTGSICSTLVRKSFITSHAQHVGAPRQPHAIGTSSHQC